MLKSQKQESVKEIEEIYKNSKSVIISHCHGLTVSQMMELRKSLRDKGAQFKIVKNTLSRIAAKNTGLAAPDEAFAGPTAIAFSEDPIAAAKGVVEFAKKYQNLKIMSGVIDNKYIGKEDIDKYAKLPSLDELRAQLIGVISAPASKIARILVEPGSQVARVVAAYSNK